ncbi:MAG: hypothetical protein RL748_3114 [Pseudomonadota bacterium]|jgi:hypothetical protein
MTQHIVNLKLSYTQVIRPFAPPFFRLLCPPHKNSPGHATSSFTLCNNTAMQYSIQFGASF